MKDEHNSRMQSCLERFQRGDPAATNELLARSCERLRGLAHDMLRSYPRVKRWEETADVLQSALMRLHRTLQQVTPATLRDYYRLAALQIRRELLDLVRHHYGPEGSGAHRQTNPGAAPADSGPPAAYDRADVSLQPDRLAAWTDFHRQAAALPEPEREAFDLVWYQGLSLEDAAAVLGVSPRTVRRYLHGAKLRLQGALGDGLPA